MAVKRKQGRAIEIAPRLCLLAIGQDANQQVAREMRRRGSSHQRAPKPALYVEIESVQALDLGDAKSATVACSRTASKAIFAFTAAS